MSHIVYSGAFGAQNRFHALVDQYVFQNKRAEICYAEHVFLHPMGFHFGIDLIKKTRQDTLCRTCVFTSEAGGSGGHVVHSGASRARNIDALFFML
jgi:hypothetical protein